MEAACDNVRVIFKPVVFMKYFTIRSNSAWWATDDLCSLFCRG